MTAQFFMGLALIAVVFFLCFWFRNDNRGK